MKKSGFWYDLYHYFTLGEKALWCGSVVLVLGAFLIFDRGNYMTLTASLVGVTSLILDAKANPIGQVLMVVFSLLYGIISFSCAYYGEMITYLGMTAPMSVFYFILRAFGTANLGLSTVSVLTSFLAVALTYKRSPLFALAYAANDAVLIGLWAAASLSDLSYLSVTVCFVVFLVNDSYTFFNWRRLQKRQQK